MIDLSLHISPDSPDALYLQIAQALRDAIGGGQMTTGTRLPASRALAQDLGVSRTTIVQAYDQLTAEGYLNARRGAGVFVADVAPIRGPARESVATDTSRQQDIDLTLTPGDPDPKLFPARAWAQCVARVARKSPFALSQSQDPFGDPCLRQEIASYLGRWRGIDATKEQILVTSGAREALELAMDYLTPPGDIALERPGFSPLRRYALARGWPVRWLDLDEFGAKLPAQMAKVTVLTPSHQFPLGGALPVARRQQFLAAAKQRGGWIIEDDFDSEFRYAGQPMPALTALDRDGRCLYVGTFSKTFSHAIRLGYLVCPAPLVDRFRNTFVHPSAGAGITPQRPLAEFMAAGQYDRHIRRARRHYGERYDIATDALLKWPDHWGQFRRHRAGMQIAFQLASGFCEDTICRAAARIGLGVRPLSACDPDHRLQGLLIGFCRSDPETLAADIARLGICVAGKA